MKFSTGAILLASLSTASAFVQPTRRAATFSRRFVVSEPSKTDEAANGTDAIVDAVVVPAEPVVVAKPVVVAEPVVVAKPVAAAAEPAAAAAAEPAAAVVEPESVLDDSSLVP